MCLSFVTKIVQKGDSLIKIGMELQSLASEY